jgi:pimeloyl-ACP methyl ester carboxylesterase
MKEKPVSNKLIKLLVLFSIVFIAGCKDNDRQHIVIREQGSFTVGGKIITAKGTFDHRQPFNTQGQSLHGDHAYVFYQIPAKAKKHPLVFLHGGDQSAKTWESTPDGRDGFQNIFLREGRGVYLVDQPRRGKAGRSLLAAPVPPAQDDQMWFTQFRMGVWPELFDDSQFPKDKEALNQFFRQMTPNTGPYDTDVISDAVAALHDKIGPSVLITHSQGGGSGWYAAIKSDNIKAVVSYEPGSGFVFPENEMPEPIPNGFATLTPVAVSVKDFKKLTQIPIVIYYGDHIPAEASDIPGFDYWRACLKMARIWAETVNRHGGDATVVHLPEIGVFGNTHFPFSDLNNREIANLLSEFLKEKNLN